MSTTSAIKVHPDELLNEFKQSANSIKARNLDLIHAVCREQFERGSKDFSVTTIAKIAVARGGPVRGTILNKTGADYKALIAAWASHTGGNPKKVYAPKPKTAIEELVDKVENVALRSILQGIIAENKKLKRKLIIAQNDEYRIIDLRTAPAQEKAASPIQILSANKLEPHVREALEHAISKEFLTSEGFAIRPDGSMVNERGRQIFKPGFVDFIRSALGNAALVPR
jgi:hypothetical protein